MHTPVLALSWEFWRRHRWGLAGVGLVVAGFALAATIQPFEAKFVPVHSMWFLMGLCYVIGVYAYGFEGRLESSTSGFPARLFLLPVRTRVLVAWPMLQGVTIAVVLWLVWERFVVRPSGLETERWWTLMLAAIVAASQAIVWRPYGLPWLRLLVAVTVLIVLTQLQLILQAVIALEAETEAVVLGSIAAVIVPVAYIAAWSGVSRARRGETPDWLAARGVGRTKSREYRERAPFASPLTAQVWYEWRTRGVGFPLVVVFCIAVVTGFALLVEHVRENLIGFGVVILLMPLILAPFWGFFLGAAGDHPRALLTLSPFAATRPRTNTSLVTAKALTAILIALSSWTIALTLYVIWITGIGGWDNLSQKWDAVAAAVGETRAAVLVAALVLVPPALIVRTLLVNLWTALTGRAWVSNVLSILTGVVGLQMGYEWVQSQSEPDRYDMLLELLPWLAAAAIVAKLLVAAGCLRWLVRRGEVRVGTVAIGLAAWSLAAAGLILFVHWLLPAGKAAWYGPVLVVLLALPLARPLLAPPALAWNRSR